ncbi:LytTR family transcriptional regulator DNA-binding domain-containing protein [Paenibacillus sp. FSL R10-2771]|uniref:LytTR family transcriptional regulator DNA-binding domain-containing protein n=1 Tax=Paenibacillus sp. FSL R10-2771 TaxID=2954693 RepID=UPI0030FA8791
MVNLPVTKDINGESGAVALSVDDILYMRHSSRLRRVVVYTADDIYYTTGPLNYWCTTLNNSGYAFSNGDRTAAINLRKVIRVNDFFKTAYFDLNSKEGCMLSKKGYEDLREQLESLSIPFVMI